MTLQQALERIGIDVIRDARANLRSLRKNSTGNLYNTMKAVVQDSQLTFEMASYGKYVDQGVGKLGPYKKRPDKMPPVSDIKNWCRVNGIDTKFAFVIARKIQEKGIKPTFFFTKAFDSNMNRLDEILDNYVDSLLTSYIDIEL